MFEGSSERIATGGTVLRETMAAVGRVAGAVGALGRTTLADHDRPDASVTFENQRTDGRTVVVQRVSTSVDATLTLQTEDTRLADPVRIDEGETRENVTFDSETELTQRQELIVDLEQLDGRIIRRRRVTVFPNLENPLAEGIETTQVAADPAAGFEYPYFLYAPGRPADDSNRPLLVEPNNTGTATNDYQRHLDAARRLARRGTPHRIADRLLAPLLVPAFPRPDGDPVEYTHDVHQLDTETMALTEGPLANVDEQLLAMAADARQRLRDRGYPVADGLMLNGFSASGNFVNRFTALHPETVVSVTAGGINGMPILPREQADGHTLEYQLGVANVEELTGEPFDQAAFADTDQFLYLGELDGSDTIGFPDSWSPRQEEIALDIYGQNMQRDRLPYAQSVYEAAGIDGAVFRIYERVGHSPGPVIDDLVEFHRRALENGDTTAFGGNVGEPEPPEAAFTVTTDTPTAGEPVGFDASDAVATSGRLVAYAWEFGDAATGATRTPETTFAEPGTYDVTLRVTDSRGGSDTARQLVTVEGGDA